MKRALNDPLFDLGELELAAEASHRNAVMLAEAGLLPEHTYGGGKGRARLWGMAGLSHMAIVGGLHKSGADWFLSAKIAGAIVKEIVEFGGYGRFPIGLNDFWREVSPGETEAPSLEEEPNQNHWDREWLLHLWLTKNRQSYTPEQGLRNDIRISIVDRRFILSGTGMRVAGEPPELQGFVPVARIEGWSRGNDAKIDSMGISGESRIRNKIYGEFISAWRDCIGKITVNGSLAIRAAMVRITKYRLDTS